MAQKFSKKSQLAILKSIRSMLLELPLNDTLFIDYWRSLAILSLNPLLGSSSLQKRIIKLYNDVNSEYISL